MRVWDLAEGGLQTTTIRPSEPRTWSVALDPTGRRLAASMLRGILRVWDLPSEQPVLEEFQAHGGRIRSIAFSPSGESLVTGSGDGLVRVWDVADGHIREEFTNPGGWARAVAVDTRGTIAVGSGSGDIHVWDRHEGKVIAQLAGHSGRVLMLAFTGDADELVSAAADGTVRVWSLRNGYQRSEIRCDSSLLCAAFDPLRRVVLASGALEMFAIHIGPFDTSR